MTAHKHPVAPVPAAGSPAAAGTNLSRGIGQHELQSCADTGLPGTVGGKSPTPNPAPTMPCRECNGKGEAEYMGLCDRYYRWADCHKCFGSGVEAAYCEMCEGPLVAELCRDCDYPSGWAFAERSALGMVKP